MTSKTLKTVVEGILDAAERNAEFGEYSCIDTPKGMSKMDIGKLLAQAALDAAGILVLPAGAEPEVGDVVEINNEGTHIIRSIKPVWELVTTTYDTSYLFKDIERIIHRPGYNGVIMEGE